jgi:hypothetical protein
MNLKAILVLLTQLFVTSPIFGQTIIPKVIMENSSKLPNEIVYKKDLLLKIEDFQGVVEPRMNAVAMAYSGVNIQYQGYSKKGDLNLEIRLYPSFDKTKSWCLPKAKNEWTLAHEQRHFEITVLNACDLFRALKKFNYSKNFQIEIIELHNKFKRINEDEQDLYDSETNHGIDKEKQAEWNKKISLRLAACIDCYE